MRFLREEPATVSRADTSKVELAELEMKGFEDGLLHSLEEQRQELASSNSPVVSQAKGGGFYSGQLMAAAGLWIGTALIPWLGGGPAVELAGYPVGVAATIFLPFSVYFGTVLNPTVPMVQRPYGIEYTRRNGYRRVIGIHGISRPMSSEEERELCAHNAEVARRERERLSARRLERRQLKRAKRAG